MSRRGQVGQIFPYPAYRARTRVYGLYMTIRPFRPQLGAIYRCDRLADYPIPPILRASAVATVADSLQNNRRHNNGNF